MPWKVHEFFFRSGLCCKQLICIGALACVIGTLIYHLEKNLYSYVIQGIYEYGYYVGVRVSLIVAFLLIVIVVIEYLYPILSIPLFCHLFVVIFLVLLISLKGLYKKTDQTTLISWIIEGSDAKENKDKNRIETNEMQARDLGHGEITMHDLRSIAGKIAVWSDFIHCTQSCCFAWILGTCFSYWIIEKNYYSGYLQDMLPTMVWSIIATLIILFIESVFIDRHRYSFVMEMKRQYEKLSPHSPYIESNTDKR